MNTLYILNKNVSLIDIDNTFIIQQDNKKIIINETVYNYLSEFKSKIDINLTLKKNSNNCIERKKILKKFYENMCKLEIIVPFDRNNNFNNSQLLNLEILDFEFISMLYEGKNTSIYECRKNNKDYILKLVSKSNKNFFVTNERLKNEYEILKKIQSKYVVKLFSLIENRDYSYLVLERIKGDNLNHFLKNNILELNKKILLIYNIIDAFSFLHSKGILHGDIHDKNILVNKNNLSIKLIDFEFSKSINDTSSKSRAGVDLFSPPEKMNEMIFDKFSELINFNSEVYQVGLLIYLIIFKKLPFNSKTWKQLKIEKEKYIYIENSNIESIDSILKKCLEVNPKMRYQNVTEIKTILQNNNVHL